jgi:hypothetical protein
MAKSQTGPQRWIRSGLGVVIPAPDFRGVKTVDQGHPSHDMDKGKKPVKANVGKVKAITAPPTKETVQSKEKKAQEDELERRRVLYDGKTWLGSLKFVGFKGKTIDLHCELSWISPSSSVVVPGPSSDQTQPPQDVFEEAECWEMLVRIGTGFCGKGETVKGILIYQKNNETIYGLRTSCLSEIIKYSPPHITIFAGDTILNQGSFPSQFSLTRLAKAGFEDISSVVSTMKAAKKGFFGFFTGGGEGGEGGGVGDASFASGVGMGGAACGGG